MASAVEQFETGPGQVVLSQLPPALQQQLLTLLVQARGASPEEAAEAQRLLANPAANPPAAAALRQNLGALVLADPGGQVRQLVETHLRTQAHDPAQAASRAILQEYAQDPMFAGKQYAVHLGQDTGQTELAKQLHGEYTRGLTPPPLQQLGEGALVTTAVAAPLAAKPLQALANRVLPGVAPRLRLPGGAGALVLPAVSAYKHLTAEGSGWNYQQRIAEQRAKNDQTVEALVAKVADPQARARYRQVLQDQNRQLAEQLQEARSDLSRPERDPATMNQVNNLLDSNDTWREAAGPQYWLGKGTQVGMAPFLPVRAAFNVVGDLNRNAWSPEVARAYQMRYGPRAGLAAVGGTLGGALGDVAARGEARAQEWETTRTPDDLIKHTVNGVFGGDPTGTLYGATRSVEKVLPDLAAMGEGLTRGTVKGLYNWATGAKLPNGQVDPHPVRRAIGNQYQATQQWMNQTGDWMANHSLTPTSWVRNPGQAAEHMFQADQKLEQDMRTRQQAWQSDRPGVDPYAPAQSLFGNPVGGATAPAKGKP